MILDSFIQVGKSRKLAPIIYLNIKFVFWNWRYRFWQFFIRLSFVMGSFRSFTQNLSKLSKSLLINFLSGMNFWNASSWVICCIWQYTVGIIIHLLLFLLSIIGLNKTKNFVLQTLESVCKEILRINFGGQLNQIDIVHLIFIIVVYWHILFIDCKTLGIRCF